MYFKISVLGLFVFLVSGCGNSGITKCSQQFLKEMNQCDISYESYSQGQINCHALALKAKDNCMAKAYGNKPY